MASTTFDEIQTNRDEWLRQPLIASLTLEHVLYGAFIIFAILSRFYDLGARVMSHDESLHTYYSYNLAMGRGFQHTPLMHGPFLFHITALSYFLFGDSDFTSRLPMALMGIALVALPWFFRRWLGRTGALVAAFALLVSPTILYHSRYIRQEQSILIWTTLTALCVWRYIENRNWRWMIGLAVVLAFHAADKSTSFLNVAMFVIFLAPLALAQLYAYRGNRRHALQLVWFGTALAILLLVLSVFYAALAGQLAVALNLKDVVVGAKPIVFSLDQQQLIFIGLLFAISVPLIIGMSYLLLKTFGEWLKIASEHAPAFNVIIVMVATTLFMGSPALLIVLNRIWKPVTGDDLAHVDLLGNMSNLSSNAQVITVMFAIAFALIAISVAIGIVWNLTRWLAVVGIFISISLPLFTTLFTNGAGVGTGYVGQLGYWMAQQDVQRGSQPPYYYFIIVPMYDYAVLIGSVCAVVYMVVRGVRWLLAYRAGTATADGSNEGDADSATLDMPRTPSHKTLFAIFLVWWMVATWLIYSIAGEKMPWLSVHFALPMALLTGWFINRTANRATLAWLRTRTGWAALGLAALGCVLIGRALALVWDTDLGAGPAAERFGFIGNMLVVMGGLAAVGMMVRKLVNPQTAVRLFGVAAFAFLAVLTIRTAIMVTYINYDYTKEFLFYAHGAPGTKVVLKQIEDLSMRLGGKEPINIGYDSDSSWPMSWYMRSFPGQRFYGEQLPGDFEDIEVIMLGDNNPKRSEIEPQLAEKYARFDYMLVWWPMQDYFDLHKSTEESQFRAGGWERIRYMLATPRARKALWEIVFNRNYKPYAELFNRQDLTPENWNPGHRFSVYVRNDIVQQVWDYRVGEVAGNPVKSATTPSTAKPTNPTGIAFAPAGAANVGSKFVIDHRANRVFELDAANAVVRSFGGFGGGQGKFNDAWGIAVDASGNIYVADTFNHRMQKFDHDGNFVLAWGKPGVSAEPGSGQDTVFFGPRDVKIDKNGNLLVSDTGNKRIQIFDADGNFLKQFGKSGTGPGEFNEPVGIALDESGNIYVADTWNKRVQVFDGNYNYVRSFVIEPWTAMDQNLLQSVEHKPYLAIDGNTLYISSPRTGQVFAYSLAGQIRPLPNVSFNATDWPTGLAIRNGELFVTNAANGQVLEFPLAAGAQ